MKLGFWRRSGKILSLGMYSGRRDQGLFREYSLGIRKDPFQGKEDAICSLIKKFFPKEERTKVLTSIKQGQHLWFETSELSCSFEDGLHKLGFFFDGERDEAGTRVVFITTSKHHTEGYYVDYSEAYVCPKCDDSNLLMDPEVKVDYDTDDGDYQYKHVKCGAKCITLYDMNPKEVKHVERKRRTLGDLINEEEPVDFVVDDAA